MYTAVVFLPLFGAIGAGILAFVNPEGEAALARRDRLAQWMTCGAMAASALLAVNLFFGVVYGPGPVTIELLDWFDAGGLQASWALKLDALSAVMLLTVSIASTMIHVYSVGYMGHDSSVPRFMSYLSLFTFCMYMLVSSSNLIQLFFGWEGVGLMSYLLIGFWYDRPSANAAAIKAFVVNRVGDFGFALGIFAAFVLFSSVNFDVIFAAAPGKAAATMNVFGREWHALTIICLLLFVGAMGKSAQLGLHTWLPDAMEGPTPVSALIHAATMVTAGVFLVARMSPLFEYSETALATVAAVGGSTAFFAATVGCAQNDIKRVIAYSTCSQLGYMFFALGVSAYQAGIFHLMTHAYFKALLFLGAGSVIHAMSGEQDMRKMGGVAGKIPFTCAMMWIGSLALVGLPPFSGFYSKDMILEAAFASHTVAGAFAFAAGAAAALLTAFYSGRLLFMTFHGQPRAGKKVMDHVHESPLVMLAPLSGLAIGAVFAGYIGYDSFVGEGASGFWGGSILNLPSHGALEAAHHVPGWVKALPLVAGVSGIGLAFVMYVLAPGVPEALARNFKGLHGFLVHKWYFDEVYDFLFVKPAFVLGRGFWKSGDGALIDGVGPDGAAAAVLDLARRAARAQTGYVYHYAFVMACGAVALITWRLF